MGLDFGQRCVDAGHSFKWFIRPLKNGDPNTIGDGLLDKVDDWEKEATWADLIVLTDNTVYMNKIDALRKQGIAVFGATSEAAELELDRDAGQKFLKENGVNTIPSKEFTDYDSAIAFVKKSGKRYVSKPSGDADKALSYLSKSPADMVFMLERWKAMGKNKAPFILQEFIPGVEIAVGGWLGPDGFCGHWFENFEHKKVFAGDLGPNCGEMGTIGRYSNNSLLAEYLLMPCEEALTAYGMACYIDVAAIMDDKGDLWPLEFTIRFGWPTYNLQASVHDGDPVRWMYDLTLGKKSLEVYNDHVAGIVMAMPDFPYERRTKEELSGFPLYHLDDIDPDCLHLCEIKQGRAPMMKGDKVIDADLPVTAGAYILVMSGRGESCTAATEMAYAELDKIEMPNSPFYRIDIGERLEDDLKALQKHGYCDGWKY